MSDASVVFLPWVRQGLAARIATPDPLTAPLPAQAPLGVTVGVNNVDAATVGVRLFGPADILGIDPRQVVRTEPPAGTDNYESNDLAAVEFDNPDLPWLFTPAAADAQGRVRPWIVLVVVRKQDGVRLRPPRTEPLPVLEIGAPALPSAELPDLADSWAWAHAQLGTHANAKEGELRTVLESRPELSVGRLLSPRLLAPFTDYIACVVPAFEVGRLAGMGEAADANGTLTPAWKSGTGAPANVSLPVYYQWEFRTGAREDFESIVARLTPRDFSDTVGRRPMDLNSPGFIFPKANPPTVLPPVMLEGALQPVNAPRAVFPDAMTQSWQDKLQAVVSAGNARSAEAADELVLGPPIYGKWFADRNEVGTVAARTWLDELNLDPRERVVAALGTKVIQEQQEELMADAWEQAGEIAKANQRLRQMQLSLAIANRLYGRHVQRMESDDALWRFAAPAQSRMVISTQAGKPPVTMRSMIAASSTPDAVISAPMRKLTRPGGIISRRAATAIRIAGLAPVSATPGTAATTSATAAAVTRTSAATTAASTHATATTAAATTAATTAISFATNTTMASSMFRLYQAQPVAMIWWIPPTRGLVSFDAVTRRLATQFASMTFARVTDFTVAQAAKQPTFTVTGESILGAPPVGPLSPVVLGTGTVLETRTVITSTQPKKTTVKKSKAAATTPVARLRTAEDGGEPFPRDPRLPVDPEPDRDPIPTHPPPPRVDSADAAAFRAAAQRHLALVNPQAPWIFIQAIQKVVLDVAAINLRALLNPAPALTLRMQSTIVMGEGAPSPVVGPIGNAPVFPQPMSEPLAALSQDWLLPGLQRVPVDSVAMLEPNERFIESYMLGLNVEMGRELLWRDFVVDDPRATFFRRFWRSVSPRGDGDIAAVAQWGVHHLGENRPVGNPSRQVVLLVRSVLFRRYPTAVVYAVPAVKVGNGRKPGPIEQEVQPLFRGALQPDVTFFGFDLDPAIATGDPGWYFVIQQQPTEPRFGFDVEIDFGDATHVPLTAPPAGHVMPAKTKWAFNGAHMAQITRQQPVRVAIHASELIKAP
jgi:hypothetical protein